MNTAVKHLQFLSGRYGLLIDAMAVVEILEYDEALCADSGSASAHHGKTVLWRDMAIPFLDLRTLLGEPAASPGHCLVLQDAQAVPLVLLGVDRVECILDIDETSWHAFSGIHPGLDTLFDRLYPHVDGQMLMRLREPALWATASAAGNVTRAADN